MKSKKANNWFWAVLAIIIIVISIVLIVAYYTGVFPKLTEAISTRVFGPIE